MLDILVAETGNLTYNSPDNDIFAKYCFGGMPSIGLPLYQHFIVCAHIVNDFTSQSVIRYCDNVDLSPSEIIVYIIT